MPREVDNKCERDNNRECAGVSGSGDGLQSLRIYADEGENMQTTTSQPAMKAAQPAALEPCGHGATPALALHAVTRAAPGPTPAELRVAPGAPKKGASVALAAEQGRSTGKIVAISGSMNCSVIGVEVRRVCGQLSISIF